MKKQEVYCPKCARLIYRYDGHHTTEIDLRCECGIYYRYIPTKNKVVQRKRPERTTSSGARYW